MSGLIQGVDSQGHLVPIRVGDQGAIQAGVNSVLRAQAVYSTSYDSGELQNFSGRGLLVFIIVTIVPGAQNLVLDINARNGLGNFVPLLTGAAITGIGNYVYIVYPGVAAAGAGVTATAGFVLPPLYSVRLIHSGAGNWTYQLESNLLP